MFRLCAFVLDNKNIFEEGHQPEIIDMTLAVIYYHPKCQCLNIDITRRPYQSMVGCINISNADQFDRSMTLAICFATFHNHSAYDIESMIMLTLYHINRQFC